MIFILNKKLKNNMKKIKNIQKKINIIKLKKKLMIFYNK